MMIFRIGVFFPLYLFLLWSSCIQPSKKVLASHFASQTASLYSLTQDISHIPQDIETATWTFSDMRYQEKLIKKKRSKSGPRM